MSRSRSKSIFAIFEEFSDANGATYYRIVRKGFDNTNAALVAISSGIRTGDLPQGTYIVARISACMKFLVNITRRDYEPEEYFGCTSSLEDESPVKTELVELDTQRVMDHFDPDPSLVPAEEEDVSDPESVT